MRVLRLHEVQLPDIPTIDHPLGQHEAGVEPADLADHELHPLLVRGPRHIDRLFHRHGHRFLTEHMFPRPHRGDRLLRVEGIRRCHRDHMYIIPV